MRNYLHILGLGCSGLALVAGCKSDSMTAADMGTSPTGALAFKSINVRTRVGELMRAAIEMQLSGEPLAETMGRKLDGYDRSALTPDEYTDPDTKQAKIDTVGYSSAVESYEYSKIMMNTLSFESGPGLSLMYGPVLNAAGMSGAAALNLLKARVQALAIASRAGVDGNGPWVMVPPPVANPLNLLGFPGLLPEFAEVRSFDPGVEPSGNAVRGCSFEGGYGASAGTAVTVGDYECGYNTLHINRQNIDKVLELDGLGYAAWKQSLWAINYFQLVHDGGGSAFTHVAAADLAKVGISGNTVVADDGMGASGMAGTYIGSSDLEGFQGMLMTDEIDNKAAFLLTKATTGDGKTLGSFATTKAALDYDYNTALRYFPHAISFTEQAGTGDADAQPTNFAIDAAAGSGDSRLSDLVALIGAYSEAFALTDKRNADVGGSSTNSPIFDGDPFPLDNGQPDGEATLHDRSLAVLKVALINLDRMQRDPATNVLCDAARVESGNIVRTRHATTTEIAQSLVALRNAYRALTAQLTLYSNSTPDTVMTTTALDATSVAGVPGGVTLAARLQQLITAQADFLSTKLLDSSGLAANGYDLAASTADTTPQTVESQAAAIRGLLEAYLATSKSTYRDRAQAAYTVLEQRYHSGELRIYRTTLGEDSTFTWTPLRFGAVQAALRQMYTLVGSTPGNEKLGTELETRLARLNKLLLNGWDDRNSDDKVDYPGECLRVETALPRGGMLMSERALTGELGSEKGALTSDRDKDCVPEVDDARLSGLLASELVLVRK